MSVVPLPYTRVSPSQRQFEENRNAELVETQRLEEQERRRREEKVSGIASLEYGH